MELGKIKQVFSKTNALTHYWNICRMEILFLLSAIYAKSHTCSNPFLVISLQAERFLIAMVIFILATLLIIYNSSSGNDSISYRGQFVYSVLSHAPSNLTKWVTKDGYIPVTGNKVRTLLCSSSLF